MAGRGRPPESGEIGRLFPISHLTAAQRRLPFSEKKNRLRYYQKMKAMREDIKAVENLKKTAEQLARTETEPARKKEEQEL